MFEIPLEYLNIHSDRKNNSPSKDVKGQQKYKKEKWQCSQNLDLCAEETRGI